MHMKARLRAHRGGNTPSRPRGWAPTQQLSNPNAIDTSAGRTRGRIAGSEEMNPATMPRGGYIPRGGFMQRGRGGGARPRDICEVECYMCHKKRHFSCNCPQHMWNQQNRQNTWNRWSEGWEAMVDDWSVIDDELAIISRNTTQTPQQSADTWLRGVANEREEVWDLVMKDLLGQEDFQRA